MPPDPRPDRVAKLLAGLRGPHPELAWRHFLDEYAGLILGISRQYAPDEDRANDCFLHVCAELCADRGRRLASFDPGRGSAFRTWLTAVVSNLCADWRRARYGRRMVPAEVERLGPLESLLYHLHFEQALDLQSCLHFARTRFPGLDPGRMSQAMSRLHQAMTPRQRWATGVFRERASGNAHRVDESEALSAPNPGPDQAADATRRHANLQAALAGLSPRQRLVLRLRFEQELSLEQVARVTGLRDLHHARRVVQAALNALREALAEPGDKP